MLVEDTFIHGLAIIKFERLSDDRGHFARVFCVRVMEQHGLKGNVVQANLAFNWLRGTVRGMHFQIPPRGETKLIRCTRGAIIDIAVDLRPESSTFLKHFAIELSAENDTSLYIPEKFAHGYQTLMDATEVSYLVTELYSPGYERTLRFDDPLLQLPWPLTVTQVSEKDRNTPLLDDARLATLRKELKA